MDGKIGKVIMSISLDNKPELTEHCRNQTNFSNYVQTLIEQDMTRLKKTTKKIDEAIELTQDEKEIYYECLNYFWEYGSMKYDGYYKMFEMQPDPDLLRVLLCDVEDRLKLAHSNTAYELLKSIREDQTLYNAFYQKISKYFRQKNPIPESWKQEIIPNLTLHEALSRIIPEALKMKDKDTSLTIKLISEIAGLTYQQTYTQLMPLIRPILNEMQIQI